jgi:hypothetical protein
MEQKNISTIVAKHNIKERLVFQLLHRRKGRVLLTFLSVALIYAAITIILKWSFYAFGFVIISWDILFIVIFGIPILAACYIIFWLSVSEFLSRRKNITIYEALKVGESRTIEFKSTFQWDLKRDQYIEERRLDILKSIAGFLNTSGGILFIGVTENTDPPTLCGLDKDLKHVGGSKDRLQRTLRDLISTRIGAEFSSLIIDSLEKKDGFLYWTLAVKESHKPVFVRWKIAGESKEKKNFYIREGPKTSNLDTEDAYNYCKNKWG